MAAMVHLIAVYNRFSFGVCRTRLRCTLMAMPATLFLSGCMTLDRQTQRFASTALTDAEAKATSLGESWSAMAPSDATLSAFHLLPNSLEAFAARVTLIDAAERTLDLQYYIFESDDTGLYIIDRLVAAADRGVRVRIMLDDMYCHGIEKNLAAFDAHPNIELRLFNPWTQRSNALCRGIEFLFTSRLNHRMHNKMFVADGVVAVLGGRNIADEYFDLSHEFEFKDLDVAAIGPVATESSRLFDAFWNGPDAIPVTGFKPMPDFEGLFEQWRTRLEAHREQMRESPFADAVRETDFVQRLKTRSVRWVVAKGRVVGDLPDKTTRDDIESWDGTLAAQVHNDFYFAKQELLISSPYFVPGKKATGKLCDLAVGGVKVRLLTNSLNATDVPIVHSGYSKYRKQLVKGGVELYELRRQTGPESASQGSGRAFGSANASLHAKSFVVDRERVFIGSLNLDPRSVVINTEVGVMIESEELASGVADAMTMLMQTKRSYRVAMSADGDLVWIGEDDNGGEITLTTEPETSWWTRFKVGFMRLLPIESQI